MLHCEIERENGGYNWHETKEKKLLVTDKVSHLYTHTHMASRYTPQRLT